MKTKVLNTDMACMAKRQFESGQTKTTSHSNLYYLAMWSATGATEPHTLHLNNASKRQYLQYKTGDTKGKCLPFSLPVTIVRARSTFKFDWLTVLDQNWLVSSVYGVYITDLFFSLHCLILL